MVENYYPIEFNASGDGFVIINNGTAPAPCVITIIPKVDMMIVKIEGLSEEPIEVAGVLANDVLVIDGEQRQVLINENPAWDRYNAWEFPKLQPGVNNIKIFNGAQAQVEIEYSARYM